MTRESCGFGFLQNNKLPASCAVLSLGDVFGDLPAPAWWQLKGGWPSE